MKLMCYLKITLNLKILKTTFIWMYDGKKKTLQPQIGHVDVDFFQENILHNFKSLQCNIWYIKIKC